MTTLVKPFSPRELMARIHALLRRPRVASGAAAGLEVDVARHRVGVDGAPIDLTPIEFGLLAALTRERDVVVTRAELMTEVWGPGYDDDHLLDVHVAKLRRKLGDDPTRPRFVETVRGVGSRLAAR